ncbi:MFS transporter [Streptomyces hirsutus]
MSDLSTTTAAAVIDQPTRPQAALPALCLTQITDWGIVTYAFPVLNPQITTDTGWSAATTTAAFSAALLVSALVGIRIGRILDARGPRTVMTTAPSSARPA